MSLALCGAMMSMIGSAALSLAPATGVPTVEPPPPARPTQEVFSQTVTVQFRSFAEVERRRRRVQGVARISAGVALLAVGTTNFFVKRGTTAEGSGLGILGTGAVSVGGGIYSLAARGPAEVFVQSEIFRHGAQEGWTPAMFDEIRRDTHREAARARKRRRIVGSLLVGGGGAAAVTISTLLGLELSQPQPDGVRASSYAQGLATSVGVVVSGIVSLATPTIIEVVAANLRKR